MRLYVASASRRGVVSWKLAGSKTTDASGTAAIVVASRSVPTAPTQMKATFGGDKSFLASESAPALLSRS